jgi:hypothetical protein
MTNKRLRQGNEKGGGDMGHVKDRREGNWGKKEMN